ncbi:MAG TPA: hydantoinase/oxoprolinase family protein [Gaiellales bacterium]|jgi:N-methylhydantoinase A|nr:hydantoinase/oxoprolinase family protein [Gaiellales bacterium]
MRALIGVDVGGTFTDVALVHDGRLTAAKVPTTVDDQSRGVVEAIDLALERAGLRVRDVGHVGHGTTVATNALLERRGAPTGFVTTAGFGDLLALRRQTRAELYRPCAQHPPPLPVVTAEVDERMGPEGVLRPLDRESVGRAAARLRRAGVKAASVCLLHSYADPSHEREVVRDLRRQLPRVFVVGSHELVAEYREYERAATTTIDAYLGPLTAAYLRALGRRSSARGLPEPLVMQSSGGLAALADAAAHPARLLLSGPAGGVAAVGGAGVQDGVAFDMGGTSCDVALIREGRAGRSTEREVGGLPVRLPMVDIHTVGAGGGSIAWLDDGGALRVGPESAGADPGPACYGRGGTRPTVTDANLVLGRLDPEVALAGRVQLDAAAAQAAVASVAGGFSSVEAAAAGIIAVANQEMVRAIRVVSVERGHDPRGVDLVAFGGAGPLHACEVAEALGMRQVVVPAASGVFSALGIAAGERRRDEVRSVMRPLRGLTARELRGLAPRPFAERGAGRHASADLRYAGQGFELEVDLEPAATLAERFHARHEERYGHSDPAAAVEVVNLRGAAVRPSAALRLRRSGRSQRVRGPAAVPLDGATLWVATGWAAARTRDGGWRVER